MLIITATLLTTIYAVRSASVGTIPPRPAACARTSTLESRRRVWPPKEARRVAPPAEEFRSAGKITHTAPGATATQLERTPICTSPCGGRQALPIVVNDNFSPYVDGDPAAGWDTDAIGWAVRKGALESDGAGRSTATPRAAPMGRTVVLEATLTPRRPTTGDWKLAGIALRLDDGDYWHLALVERPGDRGSHFVELSEMRSEQWNAQSNLVVEAAHGMELNWSYERPYRLRLELSPGGIVGVVNEIGGAELARQAFRFGPPAVTVGAPALVTCNMAAGFADFHADIRQRVQPTAPPKYPHYVNLNPGALHGRRTGFFHVERLRDRWWIVDPAGRSFYAVGTDHVNYNAHYCEKLGYAPYHRNVEKQFRGSEEQWAADAVARLKEWRFNLLGAGCGPSTFHRGIAHTDFLSLGTSFTSVSSIVTRTTWTGFPDVFHPRWQAWCDREARRICAHQRNDPWLFGYFIDNELEWFGKEYVAAGLTIETFKRPADHPAKRALIAFLRARHPDIAAFNLGWGATAASWETVAQTVTPPPIKTATARADARDFVMLIADRYFAATSSAIHKADPNHMVLGCRFAQLAPPGAIGVAGRYCDIVSVNFYGQVDLDRSVSPDMPRAMRRYYAEAKRPLMMTEWSFPALDAGLPSRHGAGQRVATQRDRARCFAIYQRALFSLPFMVGSDYFMWADEPAMGISAAFPEDSNYGLVDVNNRAWSRLTAAATHENSMVQQLHAGDSADLCVTVNDADRQGPGRERRKGGEAERSRGGSGRRARSRPTVSIANRGRSAATFDLRIWVQGEVSARRLSLAPGASTRIGLSTTRPAYVIAEADPEEKIAQSDRSHTRDERAVNARNSSQPLALVVNPTAQTLNHVPVAVSLAAAGTRWQIPGTTTQTDLLPGGAELTWRVPVLHARSLIAYPLTAATPSLSEHKSLEDHAFQVDGPLRLRHTAGSASFFDDVALGPLSLGRFGAVIHQGGDPSVWVPPTHVTRTEMWSGRVRTVLLMTAELQPSAPEAASEHDARAFRVAYRIACSPNDPWFAVRFHALENTDTRPWSFAAYYDYPVSAIGGHPETDQPGGAEGTPLWYNAAIGACYGAVLNMDRMHSVFWKDSHDGDREHPDIWRDTNIALAPGQIVRAGEDDTDVFLYGGRGSEERPDGGILTRLLATRKVRTSLLLK